MKKKPKAIVLSPGPCTPNEAGICLDLIAKAGGKIPLLGVCLGHQAIGQVYGGKVIRAPEPLHGKLSTIRHTDEGVFKGLPEKFDVTRYHSLIVERESLPDALEVTAETPDGLIMGLQHKTHPVHGVQFHPESIASQQGHALLANFLSPRRHEPAPPQRAVGARRRLRPRHARHRAEASHAEGGDGASPCRGRDQGRVRDHDVGRRQPRADGARS